MRKRREEFTNVATLFLKDFAEKYNIIISVFSGRELQPNIRCYTSKFSPSLLLARNHGEIIVANLCHSKRIVKS